MPESPPIDELAALVAGVAGDDVAGRVRFAAELDALRLVERRSYVGGGARLEDSASHSWHLATMALVLGPILGDVDLDRVVRLCLVHDIVEIDAGDVTVYDDAARAGKAAAEAAAADRLFGLLPGATGAELRALWEEFEARATAEARAAAAVDRLAPLLLNWLSAGRTWREVGVDADRVLAVNLPVAAAVDDRLAAVVEAIVGDGVHRGWLAAGPAGGH